MRVYFSAPTKNIKEKISIYKHIRCALQNRDYKITHKWIDPSYHRKVEKKGALEISEARPIFKACLKGIRNSDACVFDISKESLSVGYHIGYATTVKRKPTLLIQDKKSKTAFVLGNFISPLISRGIYSSKEEAECLVLDFISAINSKKRRIDIRISKAVNIGLDFISKKKSKTKISLICDCINKEIDRSL